MNLPNALTVGRIVASPFVAILPFFPSWQLRMLGFWLFIAVAVTDYYDGKIARTRNLVTNLGKLLDPLADKLLLTATLIPMYLIQKQTDSPSFSSLARSGTEGIAWDFRFDTPAGRYGFPFWVIAVVLGRELFMTIFRQISARRGVIIAAIGPAKWKTGFQWTWVGAAYFWFSALTAAHRYEWLDSQAWRAWAWLNGTIGVVTMYAAIALTLYSLGLYMKMYALNDGPQPKN
ncbi:MAG: CDP-alcohol phosphatidyltransferase family protein [Anaerolineae bacterium]|nr:CDP-alcohol phosphatidyltransferase family protein [Gemmatimonadaceae bacterium]